MPVSQLTVAQLLRHVHTVARSARAVSGREPVAGLRLSSALLLAHVESVGEVRCSALAEGFGLDASVVSRQLSLLENHGLTARRPDPADGRAWLSHITPAGRGLLARLRAERLDAVQRALSGWTEDDARALVAALARLETDLARSTAAPARRGTTHHREVTS
jgi:DNA-binding MarR family transcriptional regulator